MRYIILLLLFASCQKALDQRIVTNTTNVTKALSKAIDGVDVTVKLETVVLCYSYKNGEQPRPCNLYLEATITLSKSLDKNLSIMLTNGVQTTYIILSPHVTKITLNSGLTAYSNVQPIGYIYMELHTYTLIH